MFVRISERNGEAFPETPAGIEIEARGFFSSPIGTRDDGCNRFTITFRCSCILFSDFWPDHFARKYGG